MKFKQRLLISTLLIISFALQIVALPALSVESSALSINLNNFEKQMNQLGKLIDNVTQKTVQRLDDNNYRIAKCNLVITAPETGNYTFYMNSYLGGKLFVGDLTTPIINKPYSTNVGENCASIYLVKNQIYVVCVNYYSNQKYSQVTLDWAGPGFSKTKLNKNNYFDSMNSRKNNNEKNKQKVNNNSNRNYNSNNNNNYNYNSNNNYNYNSNNNYNNVNYNNNPYTTNSTNTTIDSQKPSTPYNLTATVINGSSVKLYWNAATDNQQVAGYIVYRNNVLAGTTDGLGFTDTGLTPNTQYNYIVQAYDANDNMSDLTASVSIITGTTVPTWWPNVTPTATPTVTPIYSYDTVAPTQPDYIRQTGNSTASITIAWNASSDTYGIIKYEIYRNGFIVATVPGNTLSYTDSGLVPNTTYSYTIRAFDPSNNGSQLSATLLGYSAYSTATAINSLAGTVNSNVVQLTWNPVLYAIGYNIYTTSTSSYYTTKLNVSNVVTTNAYTHSSPVTGNNYYIVRPVYAGYTEGLNSNEILVVYPPDSNANAIVTGVTAQANVSGITLNWNSTPAVIGYNIYTSNISGNYSVSPINTVPITGTTYLRTQPSVGVNYFVIKPVFSGNVLGRASTEVAVLYPLNSNITTLTAVSTNTGVQLNWPQVTGAIGYNLYNSLTSGNYTAFPITDFAVTGTSYLHTKALTGTNYYIVKPVYSGNYEGTASNEAYTTYNAVTSSAITLSVSTEGSSARLNWTNDVNALGYFIYTSSTSNGYTVVPINPTYVTTNTYLYTASVTGTNYFTVKPVYAGNVLGNSSNEVSLNMTYNKVIVLQINNPQMTVNGVSKAVDQDSGVSPELNAGSGRVFIPISALVTELGGTTTWNALENKVTIYYNNSKIEMWIGRSYLMYYSTTTSTGQRVEMDVAPYINTTYGRTMLPVRFVVQYLGVNVVWDGSNNSITITKN